MSELLEHRLELAQRMLKALGDKILHRNDWNIACMIDHARFHRMLAFLVDRGYVERTGRGIYRLTDKGRKFMEAIE